MPSWSEWAQDQVASLLAHVADAARALERIAVALERAERERDAKAERHHA